MDLPWTLPGSKWRCEAGAVACPFWQLWQQCPVFWEVSVSQAIIFGVHSGSHAVCNMIWALSSSSSPFSEAASSVLPEILRLSPCPFTKFFSAHTGLVSVWCLQTRALMGSPAPHSACSSCPPASAFLLESWEIISTDTLSTWPITMVMGGWPSTPSSDSCVFHGTDQQRNHWSLLVLKIPLTSLRNKNM